jgi:hypothetical protein
LALLDGLRRHGPSERLQKVLDEVEAEVRSAGNPEPADCTGRRAKVATD